jgi:ribosomal protein S27AE
VEQSVNPDPEVGKLRARLGVLEREVALLARDLPTTEHTPSQDSAPANRDARWHCQKCGYLLGFYDVREDVLRTRYKEHIVFVRCGEGGFVQVVCRGCSEVNTATGEGAPSSSD